MRKIVISGAGSGLGRTVQQVNALGASAFFHLCDITKPWDVDKLAVVLAERWNSLDLLVNNAGVATAGSVESETMQQWQWVMDINVLGHVRMTKAMLPLLRNSNASERDIINIASQAGLTPAPGMGSYSVSKAAMVCYAETAHLELAHEGIHVSVVCPAFFETNLDQSLRTDDPTMQRVVSKMIRKSGVSAESIADDIFNHVSARKFMLVTHKNGRNAHRLKRFLPIDRYMKIMKERTKKFVVKSD